MKIINIVILVVSIFFSFITCCDVYSQSSRAVTAGSVEARRMESRIWGGGNASVVRGNKENLDSPEEIELKKLFGGISFVYINDLLKKKGTDVFWSRVTGLNTTTNRFQILKRNLDILSDKGIPLPVAFIVTSSPAEKSEIKGIFGTSFERATIFTLVDGKGFRSVDALKEYLSSNKKSEVELTIWENKGEKYKSRKLLLKRELGKKPTDEETEVQPEDESEENLYETQREQELNELTGKSADGKLTLTVQSNIVYIPKGGVTVFKPFAQITFADSELIAGYFNVNGKPEKLKIQSNDKNILAIFSPDEVSKKTEFNKLQDFVYCFKKAGEVSVTASAGNENAVVKLNVVELPFSIGDRASSVIEALGFPKQDKDESSSSMVVSWPDFRWVDGIGYQPDAGERITITHWKYDKYPRLVLAMKNDKISEISVEGFYYLGHLLLGNEPDVVKFFE